MSPRAAALLALASLAPATTHGAPVFTATEMMKTKRLADPQVSPDGSLVAFELKETPLDGTSNSDLWLVPVSGGEPRRLTSHPASDTRPRWSPDGRRLAEAGKPSSARVYDALLDATRTITEVRE